MASSWTPGDLENGPIDRGYFVTLPDSQPDSEGEGIRASNAYLENGKGERVWLWLNDIQSNFNLAGTTAQSKGKRSFFPHNLTQPSLTLGGQTPNSYQYNRIAEFVRDFHKSILRDDNPLKLGVTAGGPVTIRPIIKGKRDSILVEGYVTSVRKGAERWINAPDYSFEFIISRVVKLLGLHDDPIRRIYYKNIMDILEDSQYGLHFEEGGAIDYSAEEGRLNNGPSPSPAGDDSVEPPPVGHPIGE
jgi:hypothetical protein